ncbi:HAD family acid phosphatase [Qipengyuania marisflavi]|uniref:Acid phosphatase n=1 Tax=Qipengyuania marisflavi TaxID=2486356 RepID=A0A5S3P1N5_9SPHN|nr:HAD family acid phosphatase [Qipengyuania marisflavi]TMM46605.1 acid phosphatase [Qipengyuania marisflavi]
MTRAPIALAALALAGCAATPGAVPQAAAPAVPVATGGAADAPDTMRWLYASGEAAGASIQAWRMLADYAVTTSRLRRIPQSVPMGLPDVAGGIGTPSCVAADGTLKPFAAVFDVDETVLLNRGYEYWQAYSGKGFDREEWAQWEAGGAAQIAPVPGAVTGIRRLREAGITVIFNTNRNAENAAGTIAAIAAAGLGPAVHKETLFLRGDDAMGSRKDGRRAAIASKYCVIALAGDNLGDFADVFNDAETGIQARRTITARGEYAALWGAGWFAFPNPVYGAWQKGTVDEVFPPDARWQPGTTVRQAPDIMAPTDTDKGN